MFVNKKSETFEIEPVYRALSFFPYTKSEMFNSIF